MAPGSLLSVLTRLPTLASTSSNVQLVMLLISDSLPLRAFDATPLPQIDFPAYTKPEIQKILSLHAPDSLYSTSNRPDVEGDLDPAELKKIWNGLTSAVIDTYGVGMALDVPTILKISRNLWPEIVQPIIDHGVIEEETGEMVYGRVDFTGLFALAKRKGLFTGEEVLKRFLNLNANHITQGSFYESRV
jgi:Origin recognition complex (ORC) subunit 5 C-terminus